MHIIRFGPRRYNILITDPNILEYHNSDTVFPHAVSLLRVIITYIKVRWLP